MNGDGDTTAGPAWLRALAGGVARRRRAPALHPRGLLCPGVLEFPGTTGSEHRWDVPRLDEPGRCAVTVRWSRSLGLSPGLPDAIGLGLRVIDAGGPGRHLDLLLTTSRPGRLPRHVPVMRRDALAGPYTSLLAHRVGGRDRVLAAIPREGERRRVPGDPAALRAALCEAPVRMLLCAAAADEPWRGFGWLTIGPPRGGPTGATPGFDLRGNSLPGLGPPERFLRFRDAAYTASRAGHGLVVDEAPAGLPAPGPTDPGRGDGSGADRHRP
ncbi:phosphodiesterase [Streptomyces sp. ST2-7A]|uniref:phosphodiesterase n=1 Tax=Streptomyces sp. ST2-7A TaxID=2907214 RepID=UPI001F2FFA1C|nr:phosphodiesterase [Streptomyces sp. ST2-7A]MCE7079437.1 phosphodiesterase [Streptomyces sp. ST2-7A]